MGSPHSGGSTDIALTEFLRICSSEIRSDDDTVLFKAKSVETSKVSLALGVPKSCTGCWACTRGQDSYGAGICIHRDMDATYNEMIHADAIVVASPVYFGNVTSQLKALMDRTASLRIHSPVLSGKLGMGIACGYARNGGQETTLQSIHGFMLMHNMRVVGDGWPSMHYGVTIVGPTAKDKAGRDMLFSAAINLLTHLKERRK